MSSTTNSRFVNATPAAVYRAFTDPAALPAWLVPGDMTGEVHNFDLSIGGGYQMSLYYPAADQSARGKTAGNEDRYTARFVELDPPNRIVEAIKFASDDPAFAEEMVMEVILTAQNGGTLVTITFHNIPATIRPEDNEAGTDSSLDKLARYVEQG